MNPSTGSLRECKTLFDAYIRCTCKIKSYNENKDVHQKRWRSPMMISDRQIVTARK
jgi:hypothetical protein